MDLASNDKPSENSDTSPDVTWHHGTVSPEQRQANMGQRGATVWLTGLSGSGKSTVAVAAEQLLIRMGHHVYRLDGDNVRHGLCGDLGFSAQDREENIRRIAHVAQLFADAGIICLCSFVSPYRAARQQVRETHEKAGNAFFEAYVNVPLEVAESRDPKGLYAKARKGEIKNFTGIDDPFEAPESPDLDIPTHEQPVEASARQIVDALAKAGILSP